MTPSNNCLEFIKEREGCVLHAYQDQAGIWTIGWGSTIYKDGTKPKAGDIITQQQADDLLQWEVDNKATVVDSLTKNVQLNQNQFDALVSFAYNVGIGGFEFSTLLKVIRKNPNDPYIRDCFAMWNKIHVNGKMVADNGLSMRRLEEANLYFTSIIQNQ